MNKPYKNILISILISTHLYANNESITTTLTDLSRNKNLTLNYNKLEKTLKFNKGVKLLSDNKYKDAIKLFQDSKSYAKWPSTLNIAICYYKLDEYQNSKKNLIDIINSKSNKDFYVTISAYFYLYLIDNNKEYLQKITTFHTKINELSDRERDVLIDSYILLKKYNMASSVLEKNISIDFLKRAILNIKLEKHEIAYNSLEEYRKIAFTKEKLAMVEWLKLYLDLKTGDINSARKTLFKYKPSFFSTVRNKNPMKISFNRKKVPYSYYLNLIIEPQETSIIENIFYFAPYILSNNSEIYFNMTKGFLLGDITNIESLSKMVGYNKFLLNIIPLDHIERASKLRDNLPKEPRSYMYYNLGLAYAQINDYISAYEYFNKAFNLNPSNKLYSIFTRISAKYFDKKIKDVSFLDQAIKSENGKYSLESQIIYKTILDNNFSINDEHLKVDENDSLFQVAIKYAYALKQKNNKNVFLPQKYSNEPMLNLIDRLIVNSSENYIVISKLQDYLSKNINSEVFLNGPFALSKLYFNINKAIGTYDKINLKYIDSNTYLRSLSIFFLNSKHSISNDLIDKFENLQIKYELNDKESLYTAIAFAIIKKDYESAYMSLALMENLYSDRDIKFLLGIRSIQNGDFNEATENITVPLNHEYIDIEITKLESILKNL